MGIEQTVTMHPTPKATGPTIAPTASFMPSTIEQFLDASKGKLEQQKVDLKSLEEEAELYLDYLNFLKEQQNEEVEVEEAPQGKAVKGAVRKLTKFFPSPAAPVSNDSKIPREPDASTTRASNYNPSTFELVLAKRSTVLATSVVTRSTTMTPISALTSHSSSVSTPPTSKAGRIKGTIVFSPSSTTQSTIGPLTLKQNLAFAFDHTVQSETNKGDIGQVSNVNTLRSTRIPTLPQIRAAASNLLTRKPSSAIAYTSSTSVKSLMSTEGKIPD